MIFLMILLSEFMGLTIQVVELVDTSALKADAERRTGSNPVLDIPR